MPRNMSFMLTTQQVIDRTKTVTRRLGWKHLKPGELFWACEKCQGLGKGGKINRLSLARCISNTPEPVDQIKDRPDDVAKEGFPDMTPSQFVVMFCRHMKCEAGRIIQRIEYEYLSESEWPKDLQVRDHI